ncbi:TonB-dependent receptor [Alteromonas sp. C1M14]|uniref:TonB-dependent receptor n=1 Tax=Alteromonas sp. C1M14 TaxID=2841567 RepID=UPI001C08CD08|nr:TonB-dependent receptor [Alteromonas sp. C1M14]MBU2976663.1 TonB-dependent receptor [Alteromonas sp. C1M14]
MFNKSKLSRVALAVAMAAGLSTAAFAQETSSGIKGSIVGPQGSPAAGTTITITHVPTGSKKVVTVNNSGQFSLQGLRVGGPYTMEIDSDNFDDKTINDLFLQLGEPAVLNLALTDEASIERIQVTASQMGADVFGQTSPASTFNLEDLQSAPSANRDLKDIVRVDPRISISESDGEEAIICGGGNPRFSALTVDGVRMNDSFGLNQNGYPTVRMPFSFDAIDQVAVELAPFDVQYGGFTACNINAVTKSGTNELHGGVFYDFTSDSLMGDQIEDTEVDTGNFTEKRYGVNVGFPLIKDELFFFGAYEKLEGAQIFNYGPYGNQVSDADLERIREIASTVYNYDIGGMPGSMPVEDEKVLIKLDWNINNDHRASLVYNYNDGFRIDQSDDYSTALSLSSHFYEVGAKLNSTVASLYSDWTNNFSTEIRLGHISLSNRQASLDADSGFGEVRIDNVNGADVYIGPDDSRQSNEMDWNSTTAKFAGTYYLDNHTITAGYEWETLEAYNLFMQHTIGEYRFNTIDDFENGLADDIYYNNSAGTNNPADAAQRFTYDTHTLYIQDEWVIDDLTLLFGLRYDKYVSDDKPKYNAVFDDRYGYDNTTTFDGIDLLQPRLGFNYILNDNMELRGGVGLYSGGNPNVWLSNSYSNDGITNIDTYRSDFYLFDGAGNTVPLVNGGNLIYSPLQEQYDEVAAANPALGEEPSTNAVHPDFEIPNEWKFNLGFTWVTDNDYVFQADFLHNKKQDSAQIINVGWDTENVTYAADGRPIYDYIQVGSDEDGDAVYRNFLKSDLVLTNAEKDGSSTTISFAVQKSYDFGLDASVGYAYNRSKDVTPMASSVAFSNFTNFASSDPLNPGVATSNYEVPHRFTFNLRYSTEFIDGYKTSFSLFGSSQKGRPFSYTFADINIGEAQYGTDNSLLYIPDVDDANVTYADGFDQAAFNDFIDSEGLARGEIVERNSQNADWYTRLDFRLDQQLPGFMEGHSATAYFILKNVGNFLNDDWGVREIGPFVSAPVLQADLNSDGTYTYNEFYEGNTNQNGYFNEQSLWQIRVGVKYNF